MGLLLFISFINQHIPPSPAAFAFTSEDHLHKQLTLQKHERIIVLRLSSVQLIVVIHVINYANGLEFCWGEEK